MSNMSPELLALLAKGEKKYARNSSNRLKPKEGINRYRILAPTKAVCGYQAPWVPASGQFWADLGVHWIKAGENEKAIAVVGDPFICYQQPSTLAPLIDKAIASAIDEESKKLYESWKPRATILVNVLDRSKGSTTGNDPQILELTPGTWGEVMGVLAQFSAEGENILDPNEGMDISISRSGKGLNTKYQVTVAPGKGDPVSMDVFKNCHDLPAHIDKEFFRGEEEKAAAAIAQISGVNTPRIATRTPTAALTSAAAAVPDAIEEEDLSSVVDEIEAEEAAPVAGKAAPEPTAAKEAATASQDAELDDALAELENI